MIDKFIKTFKDTTIAIIPICFIVSILSYLFGINTSTIASFAISSVFLIIGMSLFTFVSDISMMIIGEKLGTKLIQSKKLFLILFITLILGFAITFAEPDLRVLANQITSIPSIVLISAVSIGVGIFLLLATLKILLKLDLRTILMISYGLVFIMACFVPNAFIPIAFDSSGVTTGPISVPFILALGIGFTAFRTDNDSKSDTFGLIALCAIGPKLTVLLLGMLYGGSNTYDTSIFSNNAPLIVQYVDQFIACFKEIFISILPIIIVFVIFKLVSKESFSNKMTNKVITGLFATFIGLCTFLTGVNVGFMKTGFLIGQNFVSTDHLIAIFPFAMLIGFLVVMVEPAIKILSSGVEDITEGSVTEKIMKITIAVGVSIAIALSLYRVLNSSDLLYFLVFGYLLAIVLSFISPKMFTSIAFDGGGCVCGPLTATFILPMIIGVCYTLGGNIITDAFGLISLVALSPLITIQLLGIIFKVKTRREIYSNIDESIVEFDWRSSL